MGKIARWWRWLVRLVPVHEASEASKLLPSVIRHVAPSTLSQIVESAKRHGRTTTQEADRLLHLALVVDKMGGSGLGRLLPAIMAFDRAGSDFVQHYGVTGDWTQDPDAYWVALVFAVEKLAEQFPGPWDGERVHAALEQALATAQHNRLQAAGLLRGEGFLSPEKRAATSVDAPPHSNPLGREIEPQNR